MWVPVVVIPPGRPSGYRRRLQPTGRQDGAAAGLGGGGAERPPGDLPALAGCGPEARGLSATSATTSRWGPRRSLRCWPRWSAGMGLLATLLRRGRASSASAATRAPATGRRREERAFPGIRRPGRGRAAGIRSPPGWSWPGSTPTTELSASSRQASRRSPGPVRPAAGPADEPKVPVLELVDHRLALDQTDGWFYEDMPEDREAWRMTLALLDEDAQDRLRRRVPSLDRDATVQSRPGGARTPTSGTASRPATSGRCGPATPARRSTPIRGPGTRSDSADRPIRGATGLGGRQARALGGAETTPRSAQSPRTVQRAATARSPPTTGRPSHPVAGSESPIHAIRPPAQRVGLVVARRTGADQPRSSSGHAPLRRRTTSSTPSSSAAGPGESTILQRLARAGWQVAALDAGPFWDPDADWVSDELGSHRLYWNEPRVISGSDPVPLGSNNSGRGVGGSMVHYAGYVPRFHPSDFRTASRDGVRRRLADLLCGPPAATTSTSRRNSRSPASPGPGVIRTPTRTRLSLWEVTARSSCGEPRLLGIETRVGPVAIANGRFGNRLHCIYRGFCLQGCKVNAKASPLITHVPDALAHGAEVRAHCMVTRVSLGADGRADGVVYRRDGVEHFQTGRYGGRGRLLHRDPPPPAPFGLEPVSRRTLQRPRPGGPLPDGARRAQTAGRFTDEIRMFKAPPPEVSEQFYETDPAKPFRRGFSIQNVSPLPITYAEHVSPRVTGARRSGSTCATTSTGPRWAPSASSCRATRTR